MNRQRHATSLLAILQDYAPNGPAQQKCTELLWSLQETWGANYDKINECMTGALIDGLRHGNWPWSSYSMQDHGDIQTDESGLEAEDVGPYGEDDIPDSGEDPDWNGPPPRRSEINTDGFGDFLNR